MNDNKLIAEALLEIAFERSETIIIESADKELIQAAKKIGIVIPSPDLAIFKTVYAEIDKPNKNNVILPKKEAIEGLPTLIGKQCNWEHKGAGYICGYIIDAKVVSDRIEIIFVMFKSLFMEQMEKIKEGFKEKKIAVSFEIWNISPDTGKSVVHPVGHKYVEIKPILYHGVGILIDNKPACPNAIIYKMIANALDVTKKVAGKVFNRNLIYASLAIQNEVENSSYVCECLECGKTITTDKHCKDIKCPECGGDMRRKDRPGKGQPVSKSIKIVTKQIDSTEWICPYCDKVIGEKELFYDDKTNKWYHRSCQEKGEIILPNENIEKEVEEVEIENLYANVKKEEDITFNIAMAFYYASDEDKEKITEEAAKWTRKFINSLPNSAFAVIEPAYPEKTDNKNCRHLPHHNGEGDLGKIKSNENIDIAHLKNALARANQIKPVTDSISAGDLQKKAMTHLNRHKDVFEKSSEETKTEETEVETKTEETPKVETEAKVEEPKVEVKTEEQPKVEETKTEETKVEETKAEVKAEENPSDKKEDKVEEKKDEKSEAEEKKEDKDKKSEKAEVEEQVKPEQQKKLVKSTMEINETIVNTYTDDKGSGDTIYKYHSKITKEFDDGTTDVVESESDKKTRYSFAELEEAIQKAKDEAKKELDKQVKAKDDEIKSLKEDSNKKLEEKDTEIKNIKAELDKKNQEIVKASVEDNRTDDLEIGEEVQEIDSEIDRRKKEISKIIASKRKE